MRVFAPQSPLRVGLGEIRRSIANRLDRLCGKEFVHFLHIGKTGGTAAKAAMSGAVCKRYRLVLHSHHFFLTDVPEGDRCVFFVRDPLSRFVSGFYSRQRQGMPRYFVPWTPAEEAAFRRFSTPGELARSLSSNDAEIQNAGVAAMNGIRHVRDSYWKWFVSEEYLASRFSDILFVGSQEHLDRDFKELRALLCLPDGCALPDNDIAAHRNPAGLDARLDDLARENLFAWYAGDYQFLHVLRTRFPNLPEYRCAAA